MNDPWRRVAHCGPLSDEEAGAQDLRCQTPELDSQEVLRGHPTVAIRHNGALYRLQTTRQGKLILTK